MKFKKIIYTLFFVGVVFFSFKCSLYAEEFLVSSSSTGLNKCLFDEGFGTNQGDGKKLVNSQEITNLTCLKYTLTSADIEKINTFTNLQFLQLKECTITDNIGFNDIPEIVLNNNTISGTVNIEKFDTLEIVQNKNLIQNLVAKNGKNVVLESNSFNNVKLEDIKSEAKLLNNEISNLEVDSIISLFMNKNRSIESFLYVGVETLRLRENTFNKAQFKLNSVSNEVILENNDFTEISTNNGSKVNNSIEIYETNLQDLTIANSRIKKIVLAAVPNLKNLNIGDSEINEFIGSGYNKLSKLIIEQSGVTGNLDLSSATNLNQLRILQSQIDGLNLKGTIGLNELYISNSNVSTVDLSTSTNLKVLVIEATPLKSINLTNNKLLENVVLTDNGLSSINLDNNTKINSLYITENNLSSLDLSKHTLLKKLNLYSNVWNSKGGSLFVQVVKPKKDILFKESLVLPAQISKDATFTGKQNKKYTSSDTSIAIVDDNGNIRTLKEGEVTITLEYTITTEVDSKQVTNTYYETNKLVVDKDADIINTSNEKNDTKTDAQSDNKNVENPKTGRNVQYTILLVIAMLGILVWFKLKKQTKFPKNN